MVSKKIIGKRNRTRGNNYERKIINELKEITHDECLKSTRQDSHFLDSQKIDISDPNNTLPFYVQIKCTQSIPAIKKLNEEVGVKDKDLVVFWNAQETRDQKQISVGEYVIITKDIFYKLLTYLYK